MQSTGVPRSLRVTKAWEYLLPLTSAEMPVVSDVTDEQPSNDRFDSLFHDVDLNEQSWQSPNTWLAEDFNDPGHQLMTDNEIVAAVLDTPTERDSDSDDEAEAHCSISHAEGCMAFETLLQ